MILSASRRTDIPAYYSDWFIKRIKEKFVMVRNPISIHQISKINISPDVVDCIVFWTKNPQPMLDKLDALKDYNFYFQFTLNSYGKDVEANVPLKSDRVINSFKGLSELIGPERVIWRYDPIFLSSKYTTEHHVEYFSEIALQLKNYTEKCTISFLDYYPKIKNNIATLSTIEMKLAEKRKVAEQISRIAFELGLSVDTCAEAIELSDLNISHAQCIDDKLIARIIGQPLTAEKDKNQRLECGCVTSIDIGLYNTCQNGCKYCYANRSNITVSKNVALYDLSSPLLCSKVEENDVVKVREVKSLVNKQLTLFDC